MNTAEQAAYAVGQLRLSRQEVERLREENRHLDVCIAAAIVLHKPRMTSRGATYCDMCLLESWPCSTVRVLGVTR